MRLIYLPSHLNRIPVLDTTQKLEATSENTEIFYSVLNFAHFHTLHSFFLPCLGEP
jgi:hypothetical protein